jgi:hypothetical protein
MPLDSKKYSNNYLSAKGFFVPSMALVVAATLSACTAGSGEGLDQNGQPVQPGVPTASQFQEIQDTIFTPICTQCHIGSGAPQGLRLDAANSYALLVNTASSEVPALMRVNPGNPNQSYLLQKIEGTAAVGGRMPLGQAPLPQDRIDLVRSWISGGAQPAAASNDPVLKVASSIPASNEVAAPGANQLTVIFAGPVDASLAASGTFELRDGFDQPVALSQVRVPEGRPNVVELTVAGVLPAGSYQLAVRGEGPVALADTHGRVLDGDADGVAGGDFLMSFDVSAGVSR